MNGYRNGYRTVLALAPAHYQVAGPRMGALTDMNVFDWLLLAGGAVVGGVGVNGLISQASSGRPNAVGVLLNIVLAGVGLSLFVREGAKAAA
jgi:hypothetical protein